MAAWKLGPPPKAIIPICLALGSVPAFGGGRSSQAATGMYEPNCAVPIVTVEIAIARAP